MARPRPEVRATTGLYSGLIRSVSRRPTLHHLPDRMAPPSAPSHWVDWSQTIAAFYTARRQGEDRALPMAPFTEGVLMELSILSSPSETPTGRTPKAL